LTGLLLLVALLATVIFFRVAFWDGQAAVKEAGGVLTWRPSFLRGEALREWAATTAVQRAQRHLRGRRTGETAVALVSEVASGAVQAMLPLARQSELERTVPCPASGQGLVGVTAVEALAIAAQIRQTHSRAEQRRIHDLALENSKLIGAATSAAAARPLPCPLQRQDCVCCVYATRPLRCRPLHARAVAKAMGSRSVHAGEGEANATTEWQHEVEVAHGVERGLAQALTSAQLDANVYELNGALARALETRDAAERWAVGKEVFRDCLRVR
jgi:hypothetical protein